MTATIGICLATYNGARFLPEQLDSIAAQTHQDWHLHVRDDGSSDGTVEVLTDFAFRYPDRVTILRDDLGQLGAKANFSHLMVATEEPYIAFSDQDDVWRPDKLAQALAEMRRLEARWGQETPVLVHADRRIVDAEGGEIAPSYWASRGVDAARFQFGTCLSFCLAAGSAMLVNRSLIDRAGQVPEAARMHDTWLELVAHAFGVVSALDKVALDWRRHEANISGAVGDSDSRAARRPWRRAARLLRGLDRQRAIYAGYWVQAAAFQDRFGVELTPYDLQRLLTFLNLPSHGAMQRLFGLSRSGLAPPGLFRQLVLTAFLPLCWVDPGNDDTAPSVSGVAPVNRAA